MQVNNKKDKTTIMTGEILIKCESALETLAEFLKNHRSIFDGCMVDFITKDIFDKVLEKDLQNDLLKLNQQEIIELPGKMLQSDLKRSLIRTYQC